MSHCSKRYKRFTKMIPSVKHLPYKTRLEKLNLRSLADLVEVFKIIHELSSVYFSTCFEYSTNNQTRGHSPKLSQQRSRLNVRHFFSERVINIWNSLDNRTVTATSLNCLKSHSFKKIHPFLNFVSLFDPRG